MLCEVLCDLCEPFIRADQLLDARPFALEPFLLALGTSKLSDFCMAFGRAKMDRIWEMFFRRALALVSISASTKTSGSI
jgi:hypothetical protein